MGNRAIVTLKNDSQARSVYLHWNGGAGSVAAILRETKRRIGREKMDLVLGDTTGKSENIVQSMKDDIENNVRVFYSTFYSVARELFGYCIPSKDISPISVYMALTKDGGGCDNGAYEVEDDFSCSRIDVDCLEEYEGNNYNMLNDFYDKVHHAMCAVVLEETIPYERRDESADIIRADMKIAKKIADNAAKRLARLEERLAAKEALDNEPEKMEAIGEVVEDS